MKTSVVSAAISKVNGLHVEHVQDLLAVEEALEIRLTHGPLFARMEQSISVTMRTPGHDKELAVGFLFSEGIISSADHVTNGQWLGDDIILIELHPELNVDLDSSHRNFFTTSSCGVCGKSSLDSIKKKIKRIENNAIVFLSALIRSLPGKMIQVQTLFEETVGIHAVGIFDGAGNIRCVREDVGRHNAFDKVIGTLLLANELPLSESLVFLSGRAGFEMVQKAAMAGVSVLAAVGAPSSLAVELASETNMTLLGFVRDDHFNIYCGASRIQV